MYRNADSMTEPGVSVTRAMDSASSAVYDIAATACGGGQGPTLGRGPDIRAVVTRVRAAATAAEQSAAARKVGRYASKYGVALAHPAVMAALLTWDSPVLHKVALDLLKTAHTKLEPSQWGEFILSKPSPLPAAGIMIPLLALAVASHAQPVVEFLTSLDVVSQDMLAAQLKAPCGGYGSDVLCCAARAGTAECVQHLLACGASGARTCTRASGSGATATPAHTVTCALHECVSRRDQSETLKILAMLQAAPGEFTTTGRLGGAVGAGAEGVAAGAGAVRSFRTSAPAPAAAVSAAKPIDLNHCDRHGMNLVMAAAASGAAPTLEECLRLCVAGSARRGQGALAATRDRSRAASESAQAGVGLSVNDRDDRGRTALWHAAHSGNQGCVDLLRRAGADQTIASHELDPDDRVWLWPPGGETPLHVAAHEGHCEVLKALLDDPKRAAGPLRQPIGDNRHTPLMLAAQGAHASCVSVLLTCLGDAACDAARETDSSGLGACALAIKSRFLNEGGVHPIGADAVTETVQLLLDAERYNVEARAWRMSGNGASDKLVSRLMLAAAFGPPAVVRRLVSVESLKDTDADGRTALHYAVNRVRTDNFREMRLAAYVAEVSEDVDACIQVLARAEPEDCDALGVHLPLRAAVLANDGQLAQQLLTAGVDPSMIDGMGHATDDIGSYYEPSSETTAMVAWLKSTSTGSADAASKWRDAADTLVFAHAVATYFSNSCVDRDAASTGATTAGAGAAASASGGPQRERELFITFDANPTARRDAAAYVTSALVVDSVLRASVASVIRACLANTDLLRRYTTAAAKVALDEIAAIEREAQHAPHASTIAVEVLCYSPALVALSVSADEAEAFRKKWNAPASELRQLVSAVALHELRRQRPQPSSWNSDFVGELGPCEHATPLSASLITVGFARPEHKCRVALFPAAASTWSARGKDCAQSLWTYLEAARACAWGRDCASARVLALYMHRAADLDFRQVYRGKDEGPRHVEQQAKDFEANAHVALLDELAGWRLDGQPRFALLCFHDKAYDKALQVVLAYLTRYDESASKYQEATIPALSG